MKEVDSMLVDTGYQILTTIAAWARGYDSYCNVKKLFCLSLILLLILLLLQSFTLFKAVFLMTLLPIMPMSIVTKHQPLASTLF